MQTQKPSASQSQNRRRKEGTGKQDCAQSKQDREAIAALAYSYWEARGAQGGSSEEDWLRAERELKASSK